ncbi:competence protein ComEC [Pacificibacter maritimus]|uniref:Competence protein ComEC n=1 Tax=Pacificibacter maritimus TaxID=762213 RepID=A0A3N4UUF2_9RHOB|nr:ComEC/Rec2 family competence protein [Pacificibacter maritimus]RPE71191.1 competence protein ComEC [Pacificibacter maritimus]
MAIDTLNLVKEAPVRIAYTLVYGFFDIFDRQHGQMFLWMPVMLGLGISLYFAAPLEPQMFSYICAACVAAVCFALLLVVSDYYAPPVAILAMVALGFLVAGYRAHSLSAPVLPYRYYGPVEGRIVKVDRSASDAVRLTLDQVRLRGFAREDTPARVRISLYGDQAYIDPEPGLPVAITASLSPPASAADPGGFNFQRMAWFDQLGAVGYTRIPVLRLGPTDPDLRLFVHKLRQKLSLAIQNSLSGQAGAFAAAILTGDRSAISAQTVENLRASNLSHLLAISGLHMGLLTGVIFSTLRGILALIPYTFYHWPNKKIAAVAALIGGACYLALSGWNVATERAYIMVSMMFIAVLLDRQAITLRAVAMAAMLILLLRPEVLPEPGFQMSFAATTALVAVFSILRGFKVMYKWPRFLTGAFTVVLSSAVAGVATAPVAAAHFNRIADLGLIANVISVPVMGAVVMPAAVIAAVLAPFGLQHWAFAVMEPAIRWLLYVADRVAQIEGAVTWIKSPPTATLPLIALGGLFVLLWKGRSQFLGLLPVILGFLFWAGGDRPSLLVSSDGGLIGRMTAEGRALNKDTGGSFAASSWLENDGDFPSQTKAAARYMPPLGLSGISIAHVSGRGWQARADAACKSYDIVILNQDLDFSAELPCLMLDLSYLERSGSLAFFADPDGIQIQTAHGASGIRLWTAPDISIGRYGRAPVSPMVYRDSQTRPIFGLRVTRNGQRVPLAP